MEKLYTVSEIKDYLKVDKTTVYRYINDGKLPSIKIEGLVRVKECEFKKFIKEG